MQRLGQVPKGCGADTQVRIRKVPVQRLSQVARVPVHIPWSGSGRFRGFGGFRYRGYVKFRRVSVQMRRSGSGSFRCTYPGQVPEGSGAEDR